MIYRLNRFSHFVPTSVLKGLATRAGLLKLRRGRWLFVRISQTAIVTRERDALGPIANALRMERSELLERLIEELDYRPRLLGVLVNDGLFVHAESFGKAILRISK